MALMDVFTHFSIIRRERRGIRPEEIKSPMGIDKWPSEGGKIFPLSAWECWQLYHRLQTLDIECKCSLHQLLPVRINGRNQLL
ncbi:Asr1405/Asl0597 family protein [Microcystis sp. M034S2]|uniref:Asr1405/Asl0597 family protein n=2 Tax=Microcystis TaxID=1125 RepID=UPI00338F9ED0